MTHARTVIITFGVVEKEIAENKGKLCDARIVAAGAGEKAQEAMSNSGELSL